MLLLKQFWANVQPALMNFVRHALDIFIAVFGG
jgi:hypothetical protein